MKHIVLTCLLGAVTGLSTPAMAGPGSPGHSMTVGNSVELVGHRHGHRSNRHKRRLLDIHVGSGNHHDRGHRDNDHRGERKGKHHRQDH